LANALVVQLLDRKELDLLPNLARLHSEVAKRVHEE
jgi:hypothetical protein